MPATDPLSEIVGRSGLRPLRQALLEWYGREHRSLPWRAPPGRLPDPYHVLISEAMLQQTQVATVVGYFERFLAEFPTVDDLAAADEQRVLRLWQGLGYYRRARHLHRAAQRIVEHHGGRVPDRVDDLLDLPGIGKYTAGAVASIAHGRPEPVVDGNVARVLGRVMGLERPIDEPGPRDRLWAAAGALHEPFDPSSEADQSEADGADAEPAGGRSGAESARDGDSDAGDADSRFTPGDLNQALMELGARVCTARAPSCLLCPLQPWCVAARTGEPERYPPPRQRPNQRPVTHRVVCIRRGRQRLFVQRPEGGLWAGLWELPTLEGEPGGSPAGGKGRRVASNGHGSAKGADGKGSGGTAGPAGTSSSDGLAEWVRQRFNLRIGPPGLCGVFEHLTTHRRIRFEVWEAAVEGGRLRPRAGIWRRPDRVDDLPLANPQRRALRLIAESDDPPG